MNKHSWKEEWRETFSRYIPKVFHTHSKTIIQTALDEYDVVKDERVMLPEAMESFIQTKLEVSRLEGSKDITERVWKLLENIDYSAEDSEEQMSRAISHILSLINREEREIQAKLSRVKG